jgi:hypothetical protein
MPSWRRISAGRTIWPFEDTVVFTGGKIASYEPSVNGGTGVAAHVALRRPARDCNQDVAGSSPPGEPTVLHTCRARQAAGASRSTALCSPCQPLPGREAGADQPHEIAAPSPCLSQPTPRWTAVTVGVQRPLPLRVPIPSRGDQHIAADGPGFSGPMKAVTVPSPRPRLTRSSPAGPS